METGLRLCHSLKQRGFPLPQPPVTGVGGAVIVAVGEAVVQALCQQVAMLSDRLRQGTGQGMVIGITAKEFRAELVDGGVCNLIVRLLQKAATLPSPMAAAAEAADVGSPADQCLASLLGASCWLLLLQGCRDGLAVEEPLEQRSVDAFVRVGLCEGVYAFRLCLLFVLILKFDVIPFRL